LKSITGGEKKKTTENTEFIAITHLQTEKKGTRAKLFIYEKGCKNERPTLLFCISSPFQLQFFLSEKKFLFCIYIFLFLFLSYFRSFSLPLFLSMLQTCKSTSNWDRLLTLVCMSGCMTPTEAGRGCPPPDNFSPPPPPLLFLEPSLSCISLSLFSLWVSFPPHILHFRWGEIGRIGRGFFLRLSEMQEK
jgi:hypothetical protein